MLKSKIYIGSVTHDRLVPLRHRFDYPLYMFGIDLAELPVITGHNRLLSYNRFNLFSLWDSDYLRGSGSIREKLDRELHARGLNREVARVVLVTAPRFLGYVFNPVSFYFCYRPGGELIYFVSEINNTYDERHIYALEFADKGATDKFAQTVEKSFFVSPFNQVEHDYEFQVKDLGEDLDVAINIRNNKEMRFHSRLRARAVACTTLTQISTVLKLPLSALLTIPRIYWQAQLLRFKHRLPMLDKPDPSSPDTIKHARPTFFERAARHTIEQFLSRFNKGQLRVSYPDGTVRIFGERQGANSKATLRLNNYRLFPRLIRDGGIGLGESYVAGEWTTDDLPTFLKIVLENVHCGDEQRINTNRVMRTLHRVRHWLRRNRIGQAKDNIMAHYDLGNDFFKLFLDPSMTYSSALFKSPSETLEQAQRNKLHSIIEKARIEAGNEVLEIGSGWGSFALTAARERKCRVTSLTLSERQAETVNQLRVQSGLADSVEVRLQDYRECEGQFDRIVSIEMMEAIGHQYLPDYFRQLDRLCKQDGIVVLQVITMLDQWYPEYLKRQDWIQKYIFPGSHLPSLNHLSQIITKETGFVIESVENLAPHYALTLAEWRRRFMNRLDEVRAQGFDRKFERIWEYYLASCEAEFGTRLLNVLQIVLTRPNNPTLLREDGRLSEPQHKSVQAVAS